jgi:hypothetical protein
MSAFKKIAGLVAGISAMGAIGVAVAQGVPPNPHIANPAIGAGEQTVHLTPIGETGVLAWSPPAVEQTATLTRQEDVAAAPVQDNTQVASADTTSSATTSNDTSQQVAQAPAPDNSNNSQSMGASPEPAPRPDRG